MIQVWRQSEGKLLLVVDFEEFGQLAVERLGNARDERLCLINLIAQNAGLEVHH